MQDLKTYSHKFYTKQLAESSNSAKYLVPIINSWFKPKTVIDVGCGVGAWLEVWKRQDNVTEVIGIDAQFVDKTLMRVDMGSEFIETDLNEKLPQLKRFDLAMCLEVAEHLEENRAKTFVEDLTKLSNIVLFSAAIPGQEGTKHINEQYLNYWVEKFKEHNFKCYDVVRPLIWDVQSVAWWFRQNTVLFVNDSEKLNIDLGTMQSFNCFDLIQKDLLRHKERKYYKLLSRTNKTKIPLYKLIKKVLRK
jgi:SAM-dependent methyltransferase